MEAAGEDFIREAELLSDLHLTSLLVSSPFVKHVNGDCCHMPMLPLYMSPSFSLLLGQIFSKSQLCEFLNPCAPVKFGIVME